MLCGYCNTDTPDTAPMPIGIEPPVMLCGYCNVGHSVADRQRLRD